MATFVSLPPHFLLLFLKNDIGVKANINLNSAFCNKVNRPKLEHLLKLECANRPKLKHSVLLATLWIRSEILHNVDSRVVFDLDSAKSTLSQKWIIAQEMPTIHGINGDFSITDIFKPDVLRTMQVVKKGAKYNCEYYTFWSCDDKNHQFVMRKSTREFKLLGALQFQTTFIFGTLLDGTFRADFTRNAEIRVETKKFRQCSQIERYSGQIDSNEIKSGVGIMKYNNGDIYVGQWKNDRRHGHGVFTSKSGEKFEGNWQFGKRWGQGVSTSARGCDVTSGEWLKNRQRGQYIVKYANGDSFAGRSLNNDELLGSTTYRNGDVYTGKHWKQMRHGRGVMKYKNGDKFEGEWNNGSKHGHGLFRASNGDLYRGAWRSSSFPHASKHDRGTLNGDGRIRFANGDQYDGNITYGKRQGSCVMRYANGDVFTGCWSNMRTQGVIKYASGEVYRGFVIEGKTC